MSESTGLLSSLVYSSLLVSCYGKLLAAGQDVFINFSWLCYNKNIIVHRRMVLDLESALIGLLKVGFLSSASLIKNNELLSPSSPEHSIRFSNIYLFIFGVLRVVLWETWYYNRLYLILSILWIKILMLYFLSSIATLCLLCSIISL